MEPDRLREIAKIGIAEFWNFVRKNFPHATGTSIDPGFFPQLVFAAEQAVLDWGSRNDRDEWTEIGSVVMISSSEGSTLGVVWDSDHATLRSWAKIRPLSLRYRQHGSGINHLIDFKFESGTWSFMAAHKTLVSISFVRDVRYTLRVANRALMVMAPTCEVMRFDYSPEFFGQAALLRRFVGELNMMAKLAEDKRDPGL